MSLKERITRRIKDQRTPLESRETKTYHRIIDWNIDRRVSKWLSDSREVMLVVGNMPDTVASGKNRYIDTTENWEAQRSKIHEKVREWVGERTDGEITIALCSGARGVDLDAYEAIRKLRKEKPQLQINVISILPLEKEEFKKVSVDGSIQESHYQELYAALLDDKDAVVHEPFFRPITVWEHIRRRKLKKEEVTYESAQKRAILLNGNKVESQVFSDTQRELVRLTREAYVRHSQFDKSLHVLLVTDGGDAYGGGGTNELVARVYDVFGETIVQSREARRANLDAGDSETAAKSEVIAIIQAGLTVDETGRPIKGRKLSSPLEDTEAEGSENEAYLAKVIADHRKQFDKERRFDGMITRLVTLSLRNSERREASRRRRQQNPTDA